MTQNVPSITLQMAPSAMVRVMVSGIPLVISVLLIIFQPQLALNLGWLIRGWAPLTLIAFSVLLLPAFSVPGRWAFYLAMFTHLLLYLLCLVGTWTAGAASDLQFAGIFHFG